MSLIDLQNMNHLITDLAKINSGEWYNTTFDKCITNPETDFLCPLVLASDKTTLSDMGNLHVDAIFMTTSLFNIQVRFIDFVMYC